MKKIVLCWIVLAVLFFVPFVFADDPNAGDNSMANLPDAGMGGSSSGMMGTSVQVQQRPGSNPMGAGETSVSPTGLGEEVRDPFQTQLTAPESVAPVTTFQNVAQGNFNLTGIGIDKKSSFAIINDDLYREGEEKKGLRVDKIRKKEVDIIANGTTRTLRLLPKEEVDKVQERKKQRTMVPKEDQPESLKEHSDSANLLNEGSLNFYE